MKIPFDKKLHISYSSLIGLCSLLMAKDYGFERDPAVAIACLAVVSTALGKEIYDRVSGKGTPSRADFIVSVFAGFLSVIVYEFIKTVI